MSYINLQQAQKAIRNTVRRKELQLDSQEVNILMHVLNSLPQIEETTPQKILDDFHEDIIHRGKTEEEIPVSEVEDFLFNYT